MLLVAKMRDEQTTGEKILAAALHIISERGTQDFRTRLVAEKAGVTLSTVHYHFQTKENLIQKTYDFFGARMAESFQSMLRPGLSPREALFRMMSAMTDFFSEFPGFVRSIAFDLVREGVVKDSNRSALSVGFTGMRDFLAKGGLSKREAGKLSFALISALFYPLLLGKESLRVYEIDFSDKKQRDSYIEALAKIACQE